MMYDNYLANMGELIGVVVNWDDLSSTGLAISNAKEQVYIFKTTTTAQ